MESKAMPLVELRAVGTQERSQRPHRKRRDVDHGDLVPGRAQRGGDLASDEAGAEHNHVSTRFGHRGAQREGIVKSPQAEDVSGRRQRHAGP